MAARTLKNKTQVVKEKQTNKEKKTEFSFNNTNLQLYSWVAYAGSEKQWVLFTQQQQKKSILA